jgi:hypothetical protein
MFQMATPRFYVEKVTSIETAQETGMVRLTFGVSEQGKDENVVQLVIHAGDLNKAFQSVGQKMQSTFGGAGGPGGPGGRPGGRPGGPGGPKGPGGGRPGGPGGPKGPGKGPTLTGFKDLTNE